MCAASHCPGERNRSFTIGRFLLALGGLFVLALTPTLFGEEEKNPALTEAQKKVRDAIVLSLQKGAMYLKATQNPQGNWGVGVHPVGYAALPALAMLEAGVPAEDLSIVKAALFVRNAAPQIDKTYELALAILFLNKLGDPNDDAIIRSFALRLIAGQGTHGGWSYQCPILSAKEEQSLLNFLQNNPPRFDPLAKVISHPHLLPLPKSMQSLIDPVVKKERESGIDLTSKSLPLLDLLPSITTKDPKTTPTPANDPLKKDSQYTPSPTPAPKPSADPAPPTPDPVPVEKKDTKPAKGTFVPLRDYSSPKEGKPDAKEKDAKKDKEKEKDAKKPAKDAGNWPSVAQFITQNLRPGNPQIAMIQQKDDNSNTQFAILALWAARKHDVPMPLTLVRLDRRFRNSQHPNGGWAYHIDNMGALFPGGGLKAPKGKFETPTASMTCVGLLGLGISHGAFQEAVLAQKKNPTPPEFVYDPAIQKGLSALSKTLVPNFGNVNLYYLWSLERVCVMYQLPTLGGIDWHTWGAQQLLPRQNLNGSWFQQGYHGSTDIADTSMALLFLSRANLNRDLSESLRRYIVVVDPSKGNLGP